LDLDEAENQVSTMWNSAYDLSKEPEEDAEDLPFHFDLVGLA